MKVTELREMFYNSRGELEQMKHTKTMKRIDNSKPFMIENQNMKCLPAPPIDCAIPQRQSKKSNFDDLMSQNSHRTSLSNSKMGSIAQSIKSGSTIVYYDYQQQNTFNWKVWLFLAIGVYIIYSMLTGITVPSSFTLYPTPNIDHSHRVQPKLSPQKQVQIQTKPSQNNVQPIQQVIESQTKQNISQQSRRLVSLYIDQLLIQSNHKLSLNKFKQLIENKESKIAIQIWEDFRGLLSTHNGIKMQATDNQQIGQLVFEL